MAAEFRAAAAGRITAERLAVLTEDIDLSRYANPDGSVIWTRWRRRWRPGLRRHEPRSVRPDPTQGARDTKTTGTDVGRDMFAARRKRTTAV